VRPTSNGWLLVLAIGSLAAAALAPVLPRGADAVIEEAGRIPGATPARGDVRLFAVPGSPGSADVDVHASHPPRYPSADPVDGWPAPAVTSELTLRSHVPANPGRAPPPTR
jgi:hypothetical protein